MSVQKENSLPIAVDKLCTVKYPVNDGEQRSPARDQDHWFNPHAHTRRDTSVVNDSILSFNQSIRIRFRKNQKTPAFLQGYGVKLKPAGNGQMAGITANYYNYFTALADISQVWFKPYTSLRGLGL